LPDKRIEKPGAKMALYKKINDSQFLAPGNYQTVRGYDHPDRTKIQSVSKKESDSAR
jgi:hypothetical protein